MFELYHIHLISYVCRYLLNQGALVDQPTLTYILIGLAFTSGAFYLLFTRALRKGVTEYADHGLLGWLYYKRADLFRHARTLLFWVTLIFVLLLLLVDTLGPDITTIATVGVLFVVALIFSGLNLTEDVRRHVAVHKSIKDSPPDDPQVPMKLGVNKKFLKQSLISIVIVIVTLTIFFWMQYT